MGEERGEAFMLAKGGGQPDQLMKTGEEERLIDEIH